MADNAGSTAPAGASGSATEGGAPSATPSTGNLNASSQAAQNDGAKGNDGDQGANSNASPKHRSLAELKDIVERGDGKLTPSEAKRIKIAALKGFSTDEEIDASEGTASKAKSPAAKKSGEQVNASTDGDGDDLSADGDDSLENDTNTDESGDDQDPDEPSDDENEDDKSAKQSKAKQELDDVLKEISPNIKDAKQAVESLKNLRREFNHRGQKINQYEKELTRLEGLDQSISQMLQSPDGVAQLMQHYGVQRPTWLGGAQSSVNSANPGQQMSQQQFDNMGDEEILTAGQVRSVVQSLVENHLSSVKSEMDQWKQERGQIREVLTSEAQRKKAEQVRRAAISDWDTGAKMLGELIPEQFGIKTSVEKIWADSVDEINENGQVRILRKAEVHPEFEKLVRIMNLRDEYINRSDASNFQDFLLRYLNQTGTFQGLLQKKAAAARANLMDQRVDAVTSRLPKAGRANVVSDSLPSSEEDFNRLPEAQRKKTSRQLIDAVRKGKIKVGV